MSKFKVILIKSLIGRPKDQCATIKALGLKKTNSVVIKDNTPSIKGMINKVVHLLKVVEIKD